MARAPGGQNAPSVGGSPRSLSKNQRRILTILRRIAPAREQLLAAMEDISPTSELHALIAAAQSPDPRERNKVAILERETEKLVSWMEELGARGLDEALRLGVIARGKGSPWQRLAELGVIRQASSERLREAKDTRDELAHAYHPSRGEPYAMRSMSLWASWTTTSSACGTGPSRTASFRRPPKGAEHPPSPGRP